MNLSEYIKAYRTEHKLTMQNLADLCGLSKGYISMLENDFIPSNTNKRIVPSINALKKLATGLGVDFDYLISMVNGDVTWEDQDQKVEAHHPSLMNLIRIPILTMAVASCGNGSYIEEDIIDWIALPSSTLSFNRKKNYFSIIAEGDSMIGAGIDNGNILVFEECDTPIENKIGLFCLDDHYSYCKKYKTMNGKPYLVSANENYFPIELSGNYRMVGLLKYVVREM